MRWKEPPGWRKRSGEGPHPHHMQLFLLPSEKAKRDRRSKLPSSKNCHEGDEESLFHKP